MKIYRSVSKDVAVDEVCSYQMTARTPGNVPYLVDNLWEWKRPERFPNRRHSVYASPNKELAQQFGGSGDGQVHQVVMEGKYKVAQIEQEDSRFHPECRSLPRAILKNLEQPWVDNAMENKIESGRLWIPCLKKEEVESIFEDVKALKAIKDKIWESIRYWDEACVLDNSSEMTNNGELFFEPLDGYRLIAIR